MVPNPRTLPTLQLPSLDFTRTTTEPMKSRLINKDPYSFIHGFWKMSNIAGVSYIVIPYVKQTIWVSMPPARLIRRTTKKRNALQPVSCTEDWPGKTYKNPEASHSALHSAMYFFGGCLALCLMCFNLLRPRKGGMEIWGVFLSKLETIWEIKRSSELHEVLEMFGCANGGWEFPEKYGENSPKRSYYTSKSLSQNLPFNCDKRSLNNCSRRSGAVAIWKVNKIVTSTWHHASYASHPSEQETKQKKIY